MSDRVNTVAEEIFAAHVKLNKASGRQARITRAVVTPGLMKINLGLDYKNNLY